MLFDRGKHAALKEGLDIFMYFVYITNRLYNQMVI
jgi:hypothetical protein